MSINVSAWGEARAQTIPTFRPRILCATDLTSRSHTAIQRTALLARQMNADVLLVHAVDERQPGRVLRMKTTRAQAQLMSLAEREFAQAPYQPRVTVRIGSPRQATIDAASEWEPDLIVLARPQKRPLDLVIGTTAERLIRATHRPVLIVSNRPLERYSNVLLATDLSDTSVHVARSASLMGVLRDAYTWVLHAFEPPPYAFLNSDVDTQLAQHRERWKSVLSRELLTKMTAEGVDASRVRLTVAAARPFGAIQQALERAQPQLLVIGTSRWFMLKRLLVGSVADEVLRQVECDILAISPPPRGVRARQDVVTETNQRAAETPAGAEALVASTSHARTAMPVDTHASV